MPDDDYDDQPEPDEDSPVVKKLRQQITSLEKDAKEAPELRKKLALHDAKLGDLSDIQRRALLSTHEGELDPEALTATAVSLGFVQPPAPAPPQVPAEEQAKLERIANATAGAEPVGGTVPKFEDQIAAAESPEALTALLEQKGIKVN